MAKKSAKKDRFKSSFPNAKKIREFRDHIERKKEPSCWDVGYAKRQLLSAARATKGNINLKDKEEGLRIWYDQIKDKKRVDPNYELANKVLDELIKDMKILVKEGYTHPVILTKQQGRDLNTEDYAGLRKAVYHAQRNALRYSNKADRSKAYKTAKKLRATAGNAEKLVGKLDQILTGEYSEKKPIFGKITASLAAFLGFIIISAILLPNKIVGYSVAMGSIYSPTTVGVILGTLFLLTLTILFVLWKKEPPIK